MKIENRLLKGLLSEWRDWRNENTSSWWCCIVLHSLTVLTGGEKLPSPTLLSSLPCLYDFAVFAFISCPFFLIFFAPEIKLFDLLYFSFFIHIGKFLPLSLLGTYKKASLLPFAVLSFWLLNQPIFMQQSCKGMPSLRTNFICNDYIAFRINWEGVLIYNRTEIVDTSFILFLKLFVKSQIWPELLSYQFHLKNNMSLVQDSNIIY